MHITLDAIEHGLAVGFALYLLWTVPICSISKGKLSFW